MRPREPFLAEAADGRQATRERSPGIVALAGLAALAVAMGIGRFAFTPILPMMQADGRISVADGGWLASANYLGYLIGATSVSVLARRIGPAVGIRVGLLVIAVTTLGMGMDDHFAGWAALRALAGIGSAVVLVFASSWSLERLSAARRPLLNGTVFAGVGVGIAVAGGICLALMRWNATAAQAWIALGVLSIVVTAAIWAVFDSHGSASRTGGTPRSTARRWNKDRVRLVICYGAFGFGYIIPSTFLPAMARLVIPNPVVFGWAWPLFGAAAAVSTLLAAFATRFFGLRRLMALSHVVMAFGVALPVWLPGIHAIMLSALLVGGTFMVITLLGMQEARAMAGIDAASLMAAMTAAFAAGQIAGPLCVSYLAGVSAPLLLACLVLLTSAAGLARRSPQNVSNG